MTEYASADEFLAETEDAAEDLTLPSGRTVRVRGLSRYEWFLAGKTTRDDADAFEVAMISMGLVAPQMTKAQIEKWRKRAGSLRDVAEISDRISALSGVGKEAAKSDPGAAGEH